MNIRKGNQRETQKDIGTERKRKGSRERQKEPETERREIKVDYSRDTQ